MREISQHCIAAGGKDGLALQLLRLSVVTDAAEGVGATSVRVNQIILSRRHPSIRSIQRQLEASKPSASSACPRPSRSRCPAPRLARWYLHRQCGSPPSELTACASRVSPVTNACAGSGTDTVGCGTGPPSAAPRSVPAPSSMSSSSRSALPTHQRWPPTCVRQLLGAQSLLRTHLQ